MPANKRPKKSRPRFNFWLDLTKREEYELYHLCEELKTKRKFASTVRDGIRLIEDLRRGQTNVLLELFPKIGVQTRVANELQMQLEELRAIMSLQSFQAMPTMLADGPQSVQKTLPKTLDLPGSFSIGDLSLEVASTPSNSSGIQNLVDTFLNF